MVIPAKKASAPPDPMAAADLSGKSQSLLHNFSFPVLKKWGNQRLLRCMKVNSKGKIIGGDRRSTASKAATSSDNRRSDEGGSQIRVPVEEAEEEGDDGGFEEVRAKLLVHLREAANRLKLVVPPMEGDEEEEPEPEPEPEPVPSSSAADPVRPWNLRTRRAPIEIGRHRSGSPPPPSLPARTVRLRSEVSGKKERRKFSITLSREEIDEDIFAVTGSLPRRRPKKRARIVQKQLDSIFPGMWLSEVTVDSYKVPE